jgi:hypothetical protein
MRYKVIPSPPSVDRLEAIHGALPLVPGSVEDCCTRIRDRTAVSSRDAAREWLTFLQALGLAAETDGGFYRVRGDCDRETLSRAYLGNVFPVREVHGTLADADCPLSTDEVFEGVRGSVPRWERNRHTDWETEWRGRVELILGWAIAFGLAERRDGRYTVE